ncbi:hypothetical protein [Sphingomonas oligophenolica]|uniref:Uncharacterized protein n=1 Tax=Sphingomonas oligophenolica TaxID=301154 RepID=A0A502CQN9_9SPHN|nr:hypothetical protein [Sphingomonas oligophenolica]TPG15537.1 hypothetical protein EAH84_01690 [Sphingomonas oligophenolica]
MNLYIVAGSLVAILALAGVAWMLRLGRDARIDGPEAAADAADQALPGFATVNAVVGADGAGALAVTGDGRVAAIKRHGARLAVREVRWDSVRATPAGMLVETGERPFGSVLVAGVSALDIRRLAPQLTRV